jgi:hypothetical protein
VPRKLSIPEIPAHDKRFVEFVRLLDELARQRCGDNNRDFFAHSAAAMSVLADAMWFSEEQRLQALVTNAPRIVVDGEPYSALSQPSSIVLHGLWGPHEVAEPLYRREGVHNGPTLKPLERRLGLANRTLLADLASAAGSLMASLTDREAHAVLVRLGFRPPSRSTLEKRVSGMLDEIAVDPHALEHACRAEERIEFEVGAISCGMDRMAVRMDETLPDGPERDAKLRAREGRTYQRRPPDPHISTWRMAQTASLTVYDREGQPRLTRRYGVPADGDAKQLAARVVDDVLHLVDQFPWASVVCIQDGAPELDVLRGRLREYLPEGVRREHVVDFHHAIAYLDAVVSQCEPDGDPHSMRSWYRSKLLQEDSGIDDILRQLVRRRANLPRGSAAREAVVSAIRYCGKRRKLMRYAALRRDGLPIGSGATESGCALFQLRVKHPGSHWRDGLAGVMTARGLSLSDRWDAGFQAFHRTLRADVVIA